MKKLEVIIEKDRNYTSKWVVKSKGDLWKDKEKWHWFLEGRLYSTKKGALDVFKRFVEGFKDEYEIELIN